MDQKGCHWWNADHFSKIKCSQRYEHAELPSFVDHQHHSWASNSNKTIQSPKSHCDIHKPALFHWQVSPQQVFHPTNHRWTARHFGSRGDTRLLEGMASAARAAQHQWHILLRDPVPEPPSSFEFSLVLPQISFKLFLSCISLASWFACWVGWLVGFFYLFGSVCMYDYI